MKLRLAVVKWLLPPTPCGATADKVGDPPSPRLRRTSDGKDVPVASWPPRPVSVAEWAEGMLAKHAEMTKPELGKAWPEHVPAVDPPSQGSGAASVEVTLYGGPGDGWVERIPAGKPWPKVLLFRVGAEAHAYEMVEGRAVFRHLRQVGFFLGCNFEKGVVWP